MVMGLAERSNGEGEGEGWKQKSAISERKALNGQGLVVRREWRGIIMRAVIQGRGCKESLGVAECGGRVGALASHGESIAKANSIDK